MLTEEKMAIEKRANCKICGKEFTYSQEWADSMLAEGLSAPEYCNEHRMRHARERSAIAMPYFYPVPLAPRRPDHELDAGRLGKLTHYDRFHRTVETTAKFHMPGSDIEFGIKDEDFLKLKEKLDNNQVVVVVGPTGSGKSTFLPYRLLAPPEPIARDYFTKYGQIVVTQPRIQATRTIPEFVARDLHGCTLGAGGEVGFIHRGDKSADNRTKLIYCTDGTLINWISQGKLADIGIIVIDEAHERSLNIDVILGLLKLKLPLYPQLKLIIASATIDTDLFINYYAKVTDTAFINFEGLKRFDYEVVWPESGISKNPNPVKDLPPHIVEKAIKILNSIASSSGENPSPEGDILIFLPTVQSIDKTCETLRDRISYEKQLVDRDIQVFPLHRRIPLEQQNLALQKKSKTLTQKTIRYFTESASKNLNLLVLALDPKSADETAKLLRETFDLNDGFKDITVKRFEGDDLANCFGKSPAVIVATFDEIKPPYPKGINQIITDRRIVVSTNLAETSLTVDGIVYVIDSGLILHKEWDVNLFLESFKASWHSQDGCKQRWGRAGRVRNGWAYPLYTKQQFEGIKNKRGEYEKKGFEEHTVPEISRAPLEAVVLSAKKAGVDDVINFPWIEKPNEKELKRAIEILKARKVIDADGDLTSHGEVVGKIGDKPDVGHLLILADQLNCAIEVATFIPMMESNVRGGLLRWHHQWDGHTRRQVRKIHDSLRFGCKDDLEFYLKLFHCWYVSYDDAWKWLTDSFFEQSWSSSIPSFNQEMQLNENVETLEHLFNKITDVKSNSDFDEIQKSYSNNTTHIQSWISEARNKYIEFRRKAWCHRFFVNYETLAKAEESRLETIKQLSIGKKQVEVRPIQFGKRLDRVRMVMGYAWTDSVYEKTNGSFKAINPRVKENEKGFDVILDQNSVVPDTVEGFVCCGKRVRMDQRRIFSNLIIHQDKEWIDEYKKPWMEFIQSVAKIESQQQTGLPVNTLFLDQLYPINCKLSIPKDDLLSNGSNGTSMIGSENISSAPPDIVETSPEGEIIYVEDPVEYLAPDLDPQAGSELDIEVYQDPEEPDPLEGLALDEFSETPLNKSQTDSQASELDIFSSLNIEKVSTQGRLRSVNDELSDPIIARVIEHKIENATTPYLDLKSIGDPNEFERFIGNFTEGDIIRVKVTEYEQLPGDKQISLVVNPEGYDLEVVMDARDLFFSGRYEFIKLIELATCFKAYIEKIDLATQRIKLTTLPLLEEHLPVPDQILKAKIFSKEKGAHLIIEQNEDERIPIPISVFVGNKHFPPAQQTLEKEAVIDIQILQQQEASVKTALISEDFLNILNNSDCEFVWEPENFKLSVNNRIKYSDLNTLLKQTNDQKLRRSLIELYIQSNRINAKSILLEQLDEYKDKEGQTITGYAINVTKNDVIIQFNEGVYAKLAKDHPHLPKYVDKGRWFECVLKKINKKTGFLEVDLPNQNDYIKRRYPEGKEFVGEITNKTKHGFFVRINNDISGLLPLQVVTAFYKVNPGFVFKVGEKKVVIINKINDDNTISLNLPSTNEDLFELYEDVDGIVIKILEYAAFVKIKHGIVGRVKKSEIAWDYVDSVAQKVSPNQKVRVKILDLSKINEGNVELSIKKADMAFKVIRIPSDKAGRVIGRKYKNINNIMQRTNTHIEIGVNGEFTIWYRRDIDIQRAIDQMNKLAI